MQFSLISTRDTNPPVFTLTFNVSDGLPTDVNCTDENNLFTIASGDLYCMVVRICYTGDTATNSYDNIFN